MTVAEDARRGQADGSHRMPSSAAVRAVSGELVGRTAELELLAATVLAPPAVAVVEGEAGIGKTRMISELRGCRRLAGMRFVTGGCRRIREPFPLGPVIDALRGMEEELRGRAVSPVVGSLRPLLPELAGVLPQMPAPLGDRAAERHRVFRGLVEVLGALSPAVLVLEDLHWADEQTLEFLSYLLADVPEGLSVVLTFRGEEVAVSVQALTAKLPSTVTRAEVILNPLDVEQTGRLAASILGAERVSAEFAEQLCVRASGVPFAVEELLALLRARGALMRQGQQWARRAIHELDVPSGIRDPVLERVSGLGADAREVVRSAAVLQEPVPLSLLMAVSRVTKHRTTRGVEEALESGLLVEDGERVGFRHLLAAQAVYEAIPTLRRIELHSRAADALDRHREVPLGQLAHHLLRGRRFTEWAHAAEKAANRAVELGDDEAAGRLLEDVLRHAPLEAAQRGRVAAKLARAVCETFQSAPELIGLLQEVLQGDLPCREAGELRFWLALVVERTGDNPALRRRLLREAVDHLDTQPHLKAWAMVGLGIPTTPGIALAEHTVWLHRALEILPEINDRAFKVFLLGKIIMILAICGDPKWRSLIPRMRAKASETQIDRREVSSLLSAGIGTCYAGDYEAAASLLTQALECAEAGDHRRLVPMIRSELALVDFYRGKWGGLRERVETLLDQLVEIPLARVDVEIVEGSLTLARGDVDEARRQLVEVAERLETMGELPLLATAVSALVRALVACGELEEARRWVDRMLDAMRIKEMWAPITRVLPAATRVVLEAGQREEAQAFISLARAELTNVDAPLGVAATNHAQGLVASCDEEWTRAADLFLAAAEMYQQLQCPYEAAQVREHAAVALFAAQGRANEAEEVLRLALTAYQKLGANWDAARCVKVGRANGVRLPVSYRGGRKGYGDMLSPREEEVARLAAAGSTNKEIGAELFLSPTTVNKHLGRAMRKLGVHSRTALAAHLPSDTERKEDAGAAV